MTDNTADYARRGDRAISYQLAGDGPARLVLVAGTGLPGTYWTLAQTAAFAEWATCLLVDNAGTGRSDPLPDGDWTPDAMAGDVVAVLDEVGWPDAHIAGHSLGSAIALALAASEPERVASLSLHSTWAATSAAPHIRAWLQARQATAAANNPDLWMRDAFFLVSPQHFARHGFTSGALGEVAELIRRMGTGSHMGQYDAGLAHDVTDELGSLDMPTLVTVGESDFVTLPAYGRAVAEAVAGAEFVELPRAGHMASLEQSAAFNGIQRRFIERAS
ncbi:MAG: alpha/beta hydrolase [bacterium]|nr:alpha/beta hydrolase [bacterium]MCY4104250.1 alpha/beta hydrolase [bacterium]